MSPVHPPALVLGFQEPHTCSLSQEGPPCSVSIADLQTFTHPAVLHLPHQELQGPESTGGARSRRHQRKA